MGKCQCNGPFDLGKGRHGAFFQERRERSSDSRKTRASNPLGSTSLSPAKLIKCSSCKRPSAGATHGRTMSASELRTTQAAASARRLPSSSRIRRTPPTKRDALHSAVSVCVGQRVGGGPKLRLEAEIGPVALGLALSHLPHAAAACPSWASAASPLFIPFSWTPMPTRPAPPAARTAHTHNNDCWAPVLD